MPSLDTLRRFLWKTSWRRLRPTPWYRLVARSVVTCCCAILFGLAIGIVRQAAAHTPHHVVTQIEISSDYESDRTLLTLVRDVLFKSEDDGEKWYRPFIGLTLRTPPTKLASSNLEPLVLLGTEGDGIYRSQDFGETWEIATEGFPKMPVTGLEISPNDAAIALAYDELGQLYRTDDRAETWKPAFKIETGEISAMTFDAQRDEVWLGTTEGRVYRSTDAGQSWAADAVSVSDSAIGALAVFVTRQDEPVILVGTQDGLLFRSLDDGQSFQSVFLGAGTLRPSEIRDIDVLSNNPDGAQVALLMAEQPPFYSRDSGATWSRYGRGLTTDIQHEKFGDPSLNEIAVPPDYKKTGRLFIAGFDGAFRSDDRGQTWTDVPTLSGRYLLAMSISPDHATDSTIAVASYMNEAYLSKNCGKTWQPISHTITDILPRRGTQRDLGRKLERPEYVSKLVRFHDIQFSPDYANDDMLLASPEYEYLRSTDRGKTWSEVPLPGREPESHRLLVTAFSPNFATDGTVFISTRYGKTIYISTDRGESFEPIGQLERNAEGKLRRVRHFAASPDFASDRTLFALTYTTLQISENAGKTWRLLSLPQELTYMTSMAISPNFAGDRTILLGTQDGLYRSSDLGESWEALSGDRVSSTDTIDAIALSPNYAEDGTAMFVVRGKGLFATENNFESMQFVGQEFADRNVPLTFIASIMSASQPLQFSPTYAEDRTVYVFGSTSAEFWSSTDVGQTWTRHAIPYQPDRLDTLKTWGYEIPFAIDTNPKIRMIPAALVAILAVLVAGGYGGLRYLLDRRWKRQVVSGALAFLTVFLALSV